MTDTAVTTAVESQTAVPAAVRPAPGFRKARPPKNRGDRIFSRILKLSALVPLLLMLLFLVVLVCGAWQSIQKFGVSFLFTNEWDPAEDREVYGALASVYGTVVSSLLALAIAAPVGIGVAAFLNEVMPARLRSVLTFLIEILATIPSIVYGIWAFFVLVPFISDHIQPLFGAVAPGFILFRGPPLGVGLMAGTLVLAVMILPLIVSISLDAIKAVPVSYREAALGLGATRWEVIRMAVLPAARSGLVGACILALGRALGETMAITMVIGNSNLIKWSLFEPAATISSVIANNFGEAFDLMRASLLELALILFVMTLLVNIAARYLVMRFAAQRERFA